MTSRGEACAGCVKLCGAVCVLDAAEWPDRTQGDIATAEARGEAWAGASHRHDPGVVERTRLRAVAATAQAEVRRKYGDGGLFD